MTSPPQKIPPIMTHNLSTQTTPPPTLIPPPDIFGGGGVRTTWGAQGVGLGDGVLVGFWKAGLV